MISREEGLEEIVRKVASCKKCPLYKTATNPVPGSGNSGAEIMFLGEGPGYWEDQKGIPFCGPAGKLLDELLSTIGLSREKVFVTNMVRHRPPENRDPMPEEMEACKEYLDEQLKIIQPKTIITLGRFSMSKFLPYGKISIDHGKARKIEYNRESYFFIPMFHPAAALRADNIDRMLREDFKKIPEEIKRLEKPIIQVVDEQVKQKEEQLTLV